MANADWHETRISHADRGENPFFIARLKSSYAFLGDAQFLPGFSVLVAYPKVSGLEALAPAGRSLFLDEMARLGAAIFEAQNPLRMNYAIYGNALPFL